MPLTLRARRARRERAGSAVGEQLAALREQTVDAAGVDEEDRRLAEAAGARFFAEAAEGLHRIDRVEDHAFGFRNLAQEIELLAGVERVADALPAVDDLE